MGDCDALVFGLQDHCAASECDGSRLELEAAEGFIWGLGVGSRVRRVIEALTHSLVKEQVEFGG